MKKSLLMMFFIVCLCVPAFAEPQSAEPYLAGGVTFQVPEGWVKTTPHSTMRLFEFKANPADASEPPVMAVFYFGPGQGGAIEENIERWKNQFTPDADDAAPQVEKIKVNGIDVTKVYLEGDYNGGMGFAGPKEDYAALNVIAEGSEGPVFFKMTGPKAGIRTVQKDFESFVQTLRSKT